MLLPMKRNNIKQRITNDCTDDNQCKHWNLMAVRSSSSSSPLRAAASHHNSSRSLFHSSFVKRILGLAGLTCLTWVIHGFIISRQPNNHNIIIMGSKHSTSTTTTIMATTITPPSTEKSAASLDCLTLVSFNIAGCIPSKEAPSSWSTKTTTEAMVEEVLRSDPDILALQEFPYRGLSRIAETFPGYQFMGSTPAHADNVALLVKKGISARPVTVDGVPAVVAELVVQSSPPFDNKTDDMAITSSPPPPSRRLLVASVHLAPFATGAELRRYQMEELLKYAKNYTPAAIGTEEVKGEGGNQQNFGYNAVVPILIAGDTNMRPTEDTVMEKTLGFFDAWKLGGSQRKTKFTWDTIDHTAEDKEKGSFNRYYGSGTRQYTARYDRVYFSKHDNVSLSVDSFDLIANRPLTNPYHFLSDHFGLSTKLRLKWKDQ